MLLDVTTFAQEHAARFVGRDWVFTRIDRWLESERAARFFIISGLPGTGKSAIAARLFCYSAGILAPPEDAKGIRAGCLSAAHFCSARDAGWTDPLRFVESIASQLCERYPLFRAALLAAIRDAPINVNAQFDVESNFGQLIGLYIHSLTIGNAPKPSAAFVRILRTPLERMFASDPKARVTVLVDGLDEAEVVVNEGDSIPSLLAQTAHFPTGFRLLVTTRPVPKLEQRLRPLHVAELSLSNDDNARLSEDDVRSFVAGALKDRGSADGNRIVESIAAKAGVNFLYAELAVRMFVGSRAPEVDARLARLPPGLEALYLEYLNRLPDDDGQWRSIYRPILGTLKVAPEPLTVQGLSTLTRLRETSVLDGLAALGQLLDVRGAPRSYRLHHQSFAEFLEEESAEQYQCRGSLFHADIARVYDELPLDVYALRWLSRHLAKAGRFEDLRRRLLDFSYLSRKLAATNVNALIADFDTFPDDPDLRLIQGAVRLSSSIIERDPGQLPSQVVGRLLPYVASPVLRRFSEEVAEAAPRPWLRPQSPALDAPGTSHVRTLGGHMHDVFAVAVTADGRRAVSGSDDATVTVWDLDAGGPRLTLRGHTWAVRTVAVLPHGRCAISGSDDFTLKLWDLTTGTLVNTLRGHTARINAVAVTPDGRCAVSGSDDMTLIGWDLESGSRCLTLREKSAPNALAVTPDGRHVLCASDDKILRVWDLQTGAAVALLRGHRWPVTAVAVTPDGRRAVSASQDATLRVWDLASGDALHVLVGHTGWISAVAVAPDGARAVSAGHDATVRVWDIENGCALGALEGHTGPVTAVAVTCDGRAVSASKDRTLKVWKLDRLSRPLRLDCHTRAVNAVAASQDCRHAVSASTDETVRIWGLQGTHTTRILTGHRGPVQAVRLSPNGRHVISASWDQTVKVWDLDSGGLLMTLEGDASAINDVVVAPDGERAVCGSDDAMLRVWNLRTGVMLRTLAGHAGFVNALALTANGQRVLSASNDATLKLWDVERGELLSTFLGHQAPIRAIAVTPDGTRAISASDDTTVRVWDLARGEAIAVLVGHRNIVNALAVTPDGRRVMSASEDRTVREWDIPAARAVRIITEHARRVSSVSVSRDGRLGVSGSDDASLRLWNIESGASIATHSCDYAVTACAFSGATAIIAGDAGGRVHLLGIE